MELLFVAAGGVFALLFVLNQIIQTVRRTPKVGFLHMLLAFLATLITVIALMQNQLRDEPLSIIKNLALGIGVLVIVPSLIVLALELRRPERPEGSRGVLGLGVGVLVLFSTSTMPLTAQTQFAALTLTPTTPVISAGSGEVSAETGTIEPTVTSSTTPSPTMTPTSTPTRRPQPTATASATRFQFVTRTPIPTATLPNPCIALTLFNVNLRAEPDREADLVTTIPFNLTVTIFGRNRDSTWWFARYEDQTGWLDGEFLTLSASCAALPERE